MSATPRATALVWQDAVAQTRDQIREQVRADVERALAEARRARAEAARAQAEARAQGQEGQLVVPPPIPPIRVQPDVQVYTGTGQPVGPFPTDIPPRAQEVAFAFLFTLAAIFIGTPLARAFGRRMDRIEQAVEAIAIEVERISEGQRYVTKVMADGRGLPSPNEAAEHELRMAERGAAERAAAERGR